MSTFVFDAYGTLYDVHSVAAATEEVFPERGEIVTQVWRLKQLEYTWLRSLMERYEDFWTVTRESLVYTLDTLGLEASKEDFDTILDSYLHLAPYPDTRDALERLREAGHRLAILSNGSQRMLDELVGNTGLEALLDAVISVDPGGVFKPSPTAYSLVRERLGAEPADVVFVSSNPFDACGAKHHGFRVAWIERVDAETLRAEAAGNGGHDPATMFRLLRTRMDALELDPDARIATLTDLVDLRL